VERWPLKLKLGRYDAAPRLRSVPVTQTSWSAFRQGVHWRRSIGGGRSYRSKGRTRVGSRWPERQCVTAQLKAQRPANSPSASFSTLSTTQDIDHHLLRFQLQPKLILELRLKKASVPEIGLRPRLPPGLRPDRPTPRSRTGFTSYLPFNPVNIHLTGRPNWPDKHLRDPLRGGIGSLASWARVPHNRHSSRRHGAHRVAILTQLYGARRPPAHRPPWAAPRPTPSAWTRFFATTSS